MISFIVPAHNEQACLPRMLQAIHESARSVGQPYEVIGFFTRRSSVEMVWYDSNRADDDKLPNSLGVQTSNAIWTLLWHWLAHF